eukprot:PhF_6_TR42725/c0_g1_i1/m.64556
MSFNTPATQGTTSYSAQPQRIRDLLLLVYVDEESSPIKVTVSCEDATGLVMSLQRTIGKPINSVSYWDNDFAQFVPLKALDNIIGDKAKIMVYTAGIRAQTVNEAKDPLEYHTIREYIDKLSLPGDGLMYSIREIQRLSNPTLEARFVARRAKLFDPNARTQIAFYTNNARPSDVAIRDGFILPATAGPYGKGIIFANDVLAKPTQTTNVRFLLCEIGTGKTVALHDEEDRGVTLEILDHMGYDSVIAVTTTLPTTPRLEEWIVYHPDQAIPRYVVTCDVVRGTPYHRMVAQRDTCSAHPGESLKLWCLQCRQLVCAYCMSMGSHKGHDCRSVTEILVKERDVLQRVQHTLDQTLFHRQNDLAELEKVRSRYQSVVTETQASIRDMISKLRVLIDTKESELMQEASEKGFAASTQLDVIVAPLQTACMQLMQKAATLKEALDISRDGTTYAKLEFLHRVNDLHTSLSTEPRYDDAPQVLGRVPNLSLRLNPHPLEHAISSLHVEDAGSEMSNLAVTTPPSLQEETLSKLRAVESGYIWVIPNVSTHFASTQTRDIFSDPFLLVGEWWELKVSPQPADCISVFLHAVKHTNRLNFKVFLFSERGWYVRSARNWTEDFRGRGWGIKPFIERKTLIDGYTQGDTLKLCVVPIGGLY